MKVFILKRVVLPLQHLGERPAMPGSGTLKQEAAWLRGWFRRVPIPDDWRAAALSGQRKIKFSQNVVSGTGNTESGSPFEKPNAVGDPQWPHSQCDEATRNPSIAAEFFLTARGTIRVPQLGVKPVRA